MRVGLLGPVVVEDGDTTEVRGARQQALLALLALHAGEVVGTDRLVDELWGDDAPANPANALQAVVSRVRRVVGADALVARPPGYALDVPADAVDASRFESLVGRGRAELAAGDAAAASATLRGALDLWRGPALGGLADHPFARAATVRLDELRGAALDAWADAELALGHHEPLVAELRGAVEADPLREGTWSRLLLALYRSGRQSEALRAYQQARTALGEQLGVEPGPELRAMESAILAQSPDLTPPAQAPPAAPAAAAEPAPVRRPRTTFLGRRAELEDLDRALADAPLVTLLGPGGVGKTRLATELAARRADAGERVVFVDLAPVAAEDDVAETFAVALGGRDQAAFTGSSLDALERAAVHVATGPVLVVVDNCEHVVDAAAHAVEAVIDASPRVRVVATSREGLAVPGEQLHPVPPLDVEDGVALFLDRARAVRPGFDPTGDERDTIAEVCRRLDGLPLAIELAAARVRALPVAEIAARLDDRFRLLTGGARTARARQQTLRAVVDWSHDLLNEEERHVLARLSAFVGGCTLDDAAAVVGGDKVEPDDVGGIVLRLVDRSLVTADADRATGTGRFGLLQTLWHYAREQLVAAGDEALVRERHARHFADVATRLSAEVRGSGQRQALDRLEVEHDNLRAALEWAVDAGDAVLGARLVGALSWFWYVRGYVAEGARWSAAVTELGGGLDPVDDAALARYTALLGMFAGRSDLPSVDRALERARQAGDRRELAESLAVVAALYPRHGDGPRAMAALEEAAAIAAEVGDRWLRGLAALLRAGMLSGTLSVEEAGRTATEAVEHFRAQGDDWGLSISLMTRATGREAVGDYDGALADYTEAHHAAERLGGDDLVQHFRIHAGNLRTLAGDPAGARRNHEEAVAVARRSGSTDVLAMALNGLGLAARRLGDLEAAFAAHDEARALYLPGHWFAGASYALAGMGFARELAGDADDAWEHHLESLALARRIDDERAVALACEGLAGAAVLRGDHEHAARLLGHAGGRRRRVGAPLPAGERTDVDRIEAALVGALGREGYEALAAEAADRDLDDLLGR